MGTKAKLMTGLVIAFLGAVIPAMNDGVVTAAEWLGIVGTVVAAALSGAFVTIRGALRAYATAVVVLVGSLATGLDGGLQVVEVVAAVLAAAVALERVYNTPDATVSDALKQAA
jgi:hypothetical protein